MMPGKTVWMGSSREKEKRNHIDARGFKIDVRKVYRCTACFRKGGRMGHTSPCTTQFLRGIGRRKRRKGENREG